MNPRAVDRYNVYLFLHIAAAIVWIGSGTMLSVQGWRADRARDLETMKRLLDDTSALSNTYFLPSAAIVLVMGLLMVVDGPWSFDQLWIILGLVGFAASLVTGVFVLAPTAKRVGALIEEERGMGPRATAGARGLLTKGRIDYVVLYLVVADMVLKPTTDDVGTLAVMAAILVAGVLYFVWRARSIAVAPA
jgi:uncharacterized membrane protein